jgi:hypothetical protein
MSFKRFRRSSGTHTARGKLHEVAAIAVLVAMALTPVVCRGLLRGGEPRPASALDGISGPAASNDTNHPGSKKDVSAAAFAEQQKQIADDSSKLFKMATDLKAEVDKTNKDTLSLNVIRKADAVEKLAHDVKEKMKTSMGME